MDSIEIVAEQLVYARVEPILSPRRTAGFQTVYHSPSLAPVKNELQQVIGDFQYDGAPQDVAGSVKRLQYFHLADGRTALSHTVPAWHAKYLDSSGRPGTFIGHCLVLAASEFARVNNDPFPIFEGFAEEFLEDADDLYERFVTTPPADDGRVRIRVTASAATDPDWPADQLQELLKAAILARATVARGGSMAFVGDPDETEGLLQAVFGLTPNKDVRRHCTFNTCADGSAILPHRFWALGFTKQPRQKHVGEIDLAGQKIVRLPQGDADQQNAYFTTWLDTALRARPCQEVLERAATIEALAEALQARRPLAGRGPFCREAIAEFGAKFKRPLAERLAQTLTPAVGDGLAGDFAAWLIAKRLPPDEAPLRALDPDRTPPAEVAEWAFCFVVWLYANQRIEMLTRPDWSRLRQLARRTEHGKLLFVTAVADPLPVLGWKRRRDQRKALALLDDQQYDDVVQSLQTEFDPVEFVTPGKSQALASKLAERKFSAPQLFLLLKALLRLREPFDASDRLCHQVRRLTPAQATALWRLCDQAVPSDEQLYDAIERRAQQGGRPSDDELIQDRLRSRPPRDSFPYSKQQREVP